MGKKSGSGMNISDHFSQSLETIFGLKLFDADPGSGIFLTQDPGWEKFGSGINIPDPQHCCYGVGGHHSKNVPEHTSKLHLWIVFSLDFKTFSLGAGLLHDSHSCWHREAQEEGIPVLRSAHYSERQGVLGSAGG
jgi:hypothetical protein